MKIEVLEKSEMSGLYPERVLVPCRFANFFMKAFVFHTVPFGFNFFPSSTTTTFSFSLSLTSAFSFFSTPLLPFIEVDFEKEEEEKEEEGEREGEEGDGFLWCCCLWKSGLIS